MNSKLKKSLYESIMKNVAKTVKSKLNESMDYDTFEHICNGLSDAFHSLDLDESTINAGFNTDIDLPYAIQNKIVKNSAGFIIEGYVANILTNRFKSSYGTGKKSYVPVNDETCEMEIKYNTNDKVYDLTAQLLSLDGEQLQTVYFEIKAFKDGKINNITLTESLRVLLNARQDNVYYILVDYSVNGTDITFNNVYVVEGADAYLEDQNHFNKNIMANAYKIY